MLFCLNTSFVKKTSNLIHLTSAYIKWMKIYLEKSNQCTINNIDYGEIFHKLKKQGTSILNFRV